MNKANEDYRKGFDAGVKAKKDDIASNYDSWKRARADRGDMNGSIFHMQDLAVRQVIYGNETGTPHHETPQTEDEA